MVDLRSLVEADTYYDLVLNINETRSDMTSDMAINFARTMSHEDCIYGFRRWEGYLKVAFM